jgi:hypothetical protein
LPEDLFTSLEPWLPSFPTHLQHKPSSRRQQLFNKRTQLPQPITTQQWQLQFSALAFTNIRWPPSTPADPFSIILNSFTKSQFSTIITEGQTCLPLHLTDITVSTSTTNIILDNLQEYKRQRRDIWFLLTGRLIVLLRIDEKYDSFNIKLSWKFAQLSIKWFIFFVFQSWDVGPRELGSANQRRPTSNEVRQKPELRRRRQVASLNFQKIR